MHGKDRTPAITANGPRPLVAGRGVDVDLLPVDLPDAIQGNDLDPNRIFQADPLLPPHRLLTGQADIGVRVAVRSTRPQRWHKPTPVAGWGRGIAHCPTRLNRAFIVLNCCARHRHPLLAVIPRVRQGLATEPSGTDGPQRRGRVEIWPIQFHMGRISARNDFFDPLHQRVMADGGQGLVILREFCRECDTRDRATRRLLGTPLDVLVLEIEPLGIDLLVGGNNRLRKCLPANAAVEGCTPSASSSKASRKVNPEPGRLANRE